MSFNVFEILDKYGVEYKTDKYSRDIDILCPFHNDNHYGSAKINEETGLFNCFACGEGGNIYHFVALLEDISDKEAYLLVESDFNRKGKYDISRLNKVHTRLDMSVLKLKEKVIDEILKKIRLTSRIDLKYKGIVICSWLKNVDIKEKQILLIYNEFNEVQ